VTNSTTQGQSRIILCIPGHWKGRTELLQAIPGTGYLFAGKALTRLGSDEVFELEVCEPDARMTRSFRSAGHHWMTADDENLLDKHSLVLYLLAQGGTHERARSAMLAAAALLRAGGYAIKVESAGIAHSKDSWLEFCENLHLFSAHKALVVYVTGEKTYSCGMQNLGLPDAIVNPDDSKDAVELIRTFTWYLFSEGPTIQHGQTFCASEGEPIYKLHVSDCDLYELDDIYFNPYGMVRLEKIRTQ